MYIYIYIYISTEAPHKLPALQEAPGGPNASDSYRYIYYY